MFVRPSVWLYPRNHLTTQVTLKGFWILKVGGGEIAKILGISKFKEILHENLRVSFLYLKDN